MEPESTPEDVLVENGYARSASSWIQEHSPGALWRSVFREDRLFLILSVFIGVFSGLAVVSFRFAIDWSRLYLLGTGAVLTPVRMLLAPTLAGLVIAVLVIHFFPTARGSGVNQTKAALYIFNGNIPIRTAIGKFITSALAIGSGHSLGPEDPSLQIGACIASLVGRKMRLQRDRMRLIAPIGAAAGLAAAFNAPISAVLFVIEEVIGRWTAGILGSVVLSAVSSVVVMRWFLGSESLFRIPAVELKRPSELIAYAALGVVGGLASVAFASGIARFRPVCKALPRWTQYFQPAVAGLLIGIIAVLGAPQVMGAGYEYIDQAMHGQFTWEFLAILAGLKIVATLLSFVSGTPGGMFAPTLFIGAMLGAAVGGAEHVLLPHLTGFSGNLRTGGYGRSLRGILARANDIGIHGARGQRELLDHCAGDPGEYHCLSHFARAATYRDLRPVDTAGWVGVAIDGGAAGRRHFACGRCDATGRRAGAGCGEDDRAGATGIGSFGGRAVAGSDDSVGLGLCNQARTADNGERGQRCDQSGRAAADPTCAISSSRSPAGDGIAVCGPVAAGAGGQPGGFPAVGGRGYAAACAGAVSGIWGGISLCSPGRLRPGCAQRNDDDWRQFCRLWRRTCPARHKIRLVLQHPDIGAAAVHMYGD